MPISPSADGSALEDKSRPDQNVHVCMHVMRDTDHDVRLRRTAAALTNVGYHVTIVDIIDPQKHIDPDTSKLPQLQPYTIRHITAPRDFQNRRFAGLSRWQTLKLAIHTMITVLKQPADIYHACEWTALPACYIAAVLQHKPLIFEAYELPLRDKPHINMQRSRRLLYAGMQLFLKYVLPRCAAVITVSPPIVQEMQRRYHLPQVTLIRNIPNYRAPIQTNLLRERLHLSKQTRIALYQGNLQPDRGLDHLILAAAHLEPGHILVLMGQNIGTTQDELEQLIALQNIGDRVKIIPAVPYASLLDWTASADIGLTIIPLNYTRNMKMSLPNKLFEYIQAGLPVLSSPLEAVQEILTTYDVGRVIHSTNPADIGAAISVMLNDQDELQRMHNNALKAAQQDLCWEKESQHLIQRYDASSKYHAKKCKPS